LKELFRITRLGIVRMQAACQKSIHAMNGIGLGTWADLEKFVIVRGFHQGFSGETHLSEPIE
jgi:hypothetical protein